MVKNLYRLALATAIASLAGSSSADQFKAPAIHTGVPVSIEAYGQQNPQCRAWTNGCMMCRSDETGHSRCSLPGIACQPAGITCKDLRQP